MLRTEEDTDAKVISLFLILFHEKKRDDLYLETAEWETVPISKSNYEFSDVIFINMAFRIIEFLKLELILKNQLVELCLPDGRTVPNYFKMCVSG